MDLYSSRYNDIKKKIIIYVSYNTHIVFHEHFTIICAIQLAVFFTLIVENFFAANHSSRSKKNLPPARALHHQARRILLFYVSVHVHEFVSRVECFERVSRGTSMVTNFLDRGFCFIIFVPFRRGHLYNVSSTAKDPLSPPVSSLPLLLLYFAVVQFLSLSLSIIIFFSVFFLLLVTEQRNFFSNATKDSERCPHSRVWFFGFSEDDCGQYYAEMNAMKENFSCILFKFGQKCLLPEGFCLFWIADRPHCNPARFFGFSSECGSVCATAELDD